MAPVAVLLDSTVVACAVGVFFVLLLCCFVWESGRHCSSREDSATLARAIVVRMVGVVLTLLPDIGLAVNWGNQGDQSLIQDS